MTPSPKICPICKREKCPCGGSLKQGFHFRDCKEVSVFEMKGIMTNEGEHRLACAKTYAEKGCTCPPAEKEADEVKVAEGILNGRKSCPHPHHRLPKGGFDWPELFKCTEQRNIAAVAIALHEAKAQGRREEREKLRKLVEEYPWDIKSKGEVLALFAGHSRASDTIKD